MGPIGGKAGRQNKFRDVGLLELNSKATTKRRHHFSEREAAVLRQPV
jgi:hypothetical protein